MFNTIISSETIGPSIQRIVIEQPEIAQARKAGQFVIVHISETGERVPLTLVDSDVDAGTITLIVQGIGKSTAELNAMKPGDTVRDIVGPLGHASEVDKYGTAVVIGGGVGTGVAFPNAVALKEAGNHVIAIVGARSKDFVILEKELNEVCDEVFICTDDGSYGYNGFVTGKLQELIDEGRKLDYVLAIGPLPMMRAAANVTKPHGIKTMASLNTIMIDGTGMCGGCRATVGGKTVFACVDGPEFDAHQIDFTTIMQRSRAYSKVEQTQAHACRLDEAELTVKERMAIPRQKMPEQEAMLRIGNFEEVNLGFTADLARKEAERCLQCKVPTCVEGCPVNVNIPEFILKIRQGKFLDAARVIEEDNVLGIVCGRVCPQSDQCEGVCVLEKRGESVAIGALERFVSDYKRRKHVIDNYTVPFVLQTDKKVAIVGSGPAGLTAAGDLVKMGHQVTVFEALHEFGGVLAYGIPEFRLPKQIVKEEVEKLERMGVAFRKNVVIGQTLTIDQLMNDQGFDAVFIGSGAGLPRFLNVPGENLVGVLSSNEFLTRVNLMKAYDFPRYETPVVECRGRVVAVIGGGNTAMDSARVALRLGAKKVYIIYRRTEAELPARDEEIHHGKDEGLVFKFLHNPVEFLGNENGVLTGVRLQQMELGEPDASGRRRPVPIEGVIDEMDIDVAIIAIGNGSNPIIKRSTPDLAFTERGNIIVDEDTQQANLEGIYAGGDIVTGGATVIRAMGAGRKAAEAIDEYLRKNDKF
ncbi:MAG: NADPH-dependent glutamate synthase [Anaerolineae bacterium]|jgi:glutamate synthase (NADPH/NADH) small chain|nr:NADPH-dependent glutamate synthase [Anaerolineae bacterium]